MALPPILVELKASSTEFMAKLGEARAEVAHLSNEGSSNFKKLQTVGKAALLGVAGVAVAVGGASLELADKFEIAHAKLEAAVKNAGGSFDEIKDRVSAADSQMAKYGFTATDTQAALAQFVVSTGSTTKGFKELGIAADLAKFKNIDLSDAALAVSKAMEGNLRPLKQLGIDLPVVSGGAEKLVTATQTLKNAQATYEQQLERLHTKHKVTKADLMSLAAAKQRMQFAQSQLNVAQNTGATVLDALSKRLGGTAAASADTFAGKTQALKAQAENLGIQLGMKLVPILENLMTKTEEVVTWFGKHKDIAQALAVVIGGGLAVAIGTYLVGALGSAAKALTLTGKAAQLFGVQAAEGEAAAELPLLPWLAAIAAVGVGAYALYKNWDTVWGFIKRITGDAVAWIIRILRYGFVDPILTYYGMILDGAAKMFGWVPGVGGKLKAADKAFQDFKNGVDSKLSSIANDADSWGQQTAAGLARGIREQTPQAISAAVALAGGTAAAARAALRIQSPSKVFHDIGAQIPMGLAAGVNAKARHAKAAVAGMLTGGTAAGGMVTPTLPGGTLAATGGATVNVTVLLDGQQVNHTLRQADARRMSRNAPFAIK